MISQRASLLLLQFLATVCFSCVAEQGLCNVEPLSHICQDETCDQYTDDDSLMAVSLLETQMVLERRTLTVEDREMSLDAEMMEEAGRPLSFYHYSLIPLLAIALVTAWHTRPQLESLDDLTPAFKAFRYKFLAVWAVAASADWLQGPYVYALYNSFGFDNGAIDKLFVVGFASSMVFGPFAGSLADSWGRKRTTLLYCILYIVSCLTKHCSMYRVLMFGRITGGMATSLLFSSFECWMVSESNQRHQFNAALLRYMFSMMYFVNYLVAIISGLVAQSLVDSVPMRKVAGFETWHYGGNICAFDMAIVMLCIAIPMICMNWEENYGDNECTQTVAESMALGFQTATSSWKISAIGIVVACFEGSMYAFVINWTPTLTVTGAPSPPHGFIFSAMMMCCMIGSSVFSFFNPRVNPAKVVVLVCVLAMLNFLVVAVTCGQAASVSMVYASFLVFEVCVGLYMPSIGALKSELVPEKARAGIYNWYRIPLNIVVCSVILAGLSVYKCFVICACLVAVAGMVVSPISVTALQEKTSGKHPSEKTQDV